MRTTAELGITGWPTLPVSDGRPCRRPRDLNAPRATAVLLAVFALFAACSSASPPDIVTGLTSASYREVDEVARSTEYLVRAEVRGPAEQARETGVLRYMVSEVEVTEVIAGRPDAQGQVKAGDIVRVGASLLGAVDAVDVDNYAELAEDFPQVDEALIAGDEVLLFMVEAARLPAVDYDLVGYGVVNGNDVTLRALPGPVNGRSYMTASVVGTFSGELQSPAPWRDPEGPATTLKVSTTQRPSTTLGPPTTTE